MENIKLNIDKAFDFASKDEIFSLSEKALKNNIALHKKTGKGSDFLGWVNLPSSSTTSEELKDINNLVSKLKDKIEIIVVIGIGGSYLGSKAVIDALSHSYAQLQKNRKSPLVVFAGQNISEDYLFELREILSDKEYALCVISKSGTTTEPAIAFRLLKQDIEKKYGKEEAKNRIIAITDKSKGALRQLANEEKYKTYIITDDIGGRYSVLTPVGLVPIAFAGFDINAFVEGAKSMEKITSSDTPFEENQAAIYAATRNALYNKGFQIELLVNYHPKLHYISEWWKQLYGESEGKDKKGIFPASVDFTSDLHSMGQYIQDGTRNLFETVISVKESNHQIVIPNDTANLDKLNFLSNKTFGEVNKMAELGTMLAHIDGGVPNLKVEMPKLNEFYLGQLLYFFEKACGISGYLLGVNPFDQPGVEAYKTNMFALLGKPGFEDATKKIWDRLK
jgi:glucose-6-phosphate isomerase